MKSVLWAINKDKILWELSLNKFFYTYLSPLKNTSNYNVCSFQENPLLSQHVKQWPIISEAINNKTCVINDPIGQTHSPTNSHHYFHAKFELFYFCDILKSRDVRTEACAKIMIPTGRDCLLSEWINIFDQESIWNLPQS